MDTIQLWHVLALFTGGGLLALVAGKNEKLASRIGLTACAIALVAAGIMSVAQFFDGGDARLLCFRVPVIVVGLAAAFHSPGYLDGHSNGRTGVYWLFFNLTLGAMYAVTSLNSFIAFLVAWELMGLFSFVLVAFDTASKAAMRAAWIYLLACEAGGMLLMLFAAFQSIDRDNMELTLFILAAAGFGLKAGFPFLHVWLPEAHPAAPAPVSAVMSGAMIPLGFCGLLRFMPELPGLWSVYGWTFLIMGLAGAFFGILSGAVRKDLKRLLAYSSVENIGIVSLGFGLGFLGLAADNPVMSKCAFAGAYLHIINHALLKGALFLGAGSVFKATHTLNVDLMGGLMKKLPLTGGCFAIASAGISGLPPFAGFTGEILIYAACFVGIANCGGAVLLGAFATAVVLALTGGAAFAAFAKAVSAVFQGLPRTELAVNARREEIRMALPVAFLLVLSLAMPLAAPFLPGMDGVAGAILRGNALFSLVFGGLVLLLWAARRMLPHDTRSPGTWDCGYAKPSARMEYTGSALIQPIADFFNGFLKQRKHIQPPEGLFPARASLDIETADFGERVFWKPLFLFFADIAERVHRFQSGYLHLYILIMTLAVAVMLLAGFAPELFHLGGGR
ncbi:MAG: proton-conducting transporter membrane subunit [Victivallaceae bacterium]|nr:proton-conducting transporter membrane subunit [Victivallaceae bacterium]